MVVAEVPISRGSKILHISQMLDPIGIWDRIEHSASFFLLWEGTSLITNISHILTGAIIAKYQFYSLHLMVVIVNVVADPKPCINTEGEGCNMVLPVFFFFFGQDFPLKIMWNRNCTVLFHNVTTFLSEAVYWDGWEYRNWLVYKKWACLCQRPSQQCSQRGHIKMKESRCS